MPKSHIVQEVVIRVTGNVWTAIQEGIAIAATENRLVRIVYGNREYRIEPRELAQFVMNTPWGSRIGGDQE